MTAIAAFEYAYQIMRQIVFAIGTCREMFMRAFRPV